MRKVLLAILDGYGLRDEEKGNAVKLANTKTLDRIFKSYPHTTIEASGLAVGLPSGQMGNSEVGHTNIGAGRIVYQDLTQINVSIENKTFFENQELVATINYAKNNNKKLHLMGLLSDGGVHSHIDHLFAILDLCNLMNFHNVYIHAILDGRDTSPTSGINYLQKLEKKLKSLGFASLATIIGRFYAMDRDKRYERILEAYNLYTQGIGEKCEKYLEKIHENYYNNITDEFMKPILVNSTGLIEKEDAVIFYNYRPDRAREITRAFIDPEFKEFERPYLNLYYTGMTIYDETLKNIHTIIKNEEIKNTLGEVIANHGLKQLRIAETEKYAHVTFFFNGGVETKYNQEDRILVNSPKDVKTYDLKPDMSAFEVTKNLILALKSNKYDLIILNFANPDMVGHTGNLEATIKAIETIDNCMEDILKEVLSNDYTMIVTADHGNSECMINPDGSINTAHTTNLVPLSIVNYQESITLNKGKLSDIAPTILDIMNIEKPVEMTGVSLIK